MHYLYSELGSNKNLFVIALFSALVISIIGNLIPKWQLYKEDLDKSNITIVKHLYISFCGTLLCFIIGSICLLIIGIYSGNLSFFESFSKMVIGTISFWFSEIKMILFNTYPNAEIGGFGRISLSINGFGDYFRWLGNFLILIAIAGLLPFPGFSVGNLILNRFNLNKKMKFILKIISISIVILLFLIFWEI